MAKLNESNSMSVQKIGGSNFTFSGARIDDLAQAGATEYTLVTIAVDETGSVMGFEKELRNMLVMAIESCKKSPRSDNLLVRVITFGSQYQNGVNEVHGFKPLYDIDVNDYPDIRPGGMTPLNDAVFSAIGATNAYAKELADNEFGVNAITFVITDGAENASVASMAMVKSELEKSVRSEVLESSVSILIGINAADARMFLDEFRREAGMDQYVDAGDASKGKLAKLAAFVSQSVSSQSQALGSGGPSQNISATI